MPGFDQRLLLFYFGPQGFDAAVVGASVAVYALRDDCEAREEAVHEGVEALC